MPDKGQVFKCESCELIVTVIKKGKGKPNCCDHEMAEVTPSDAKKLTFDLSRPGAP